MISMDKKYRTRDGRDVRLLCVDGPELRPVVGVFGDSIAMWNTDGSVGLDEHPYDLIEYHEPDIRTIWVNVYEDGVMSYVNSTQAEIASQVYGAPIAIAQPVTFEVKRT